MSAIKYATRIDLQGNEILNAITQRVNGLPTPTTALTGAQRFNTADGRFYVCDGSAWGLKATNADALAGFSPAQLRDRSTHTGSQTAATINDFDSVVNGRRISDFTVVPNKDIPHGGFKLTGVAAGLSNTDAVNLAQLNAVRDLATNAAAGIAIKEPVISAAPADVSITAPPTVIDGVTIPTNGRILLPNQTDLTTNGIYVRPATGALIRAQDADATGELVPGTQVFVAQGATYADTAWVIIGDSAITPGTTAQAWSRVPGTSGSSNTFGAGLEVINTSTVKVKPGLGITVQDGSVAIDTTIVPRKFSQVIPAGTSPIVINHALNTRRIMFPTIMENSSGDLVQVGPTVTGVNTVSLDFAVNPLTNQYDVTIIG